MPQIARRWGQVAFRKSVAPARALICDTAKVPRRNRVDPFGDLHAVSGRGMFTGNRGCLVDSNEQIVRHHAGNLWIACRLTYRDWRSPLAAPHHWTPLFFLDDAVALAAGHRPCGLCRRADYRFYKGAVVRAQPSVTPPTASDLNRQLASERLQRGRGLDRAADRRLWVEDIDKLPTGSVIVLDRVTQLVLADRLVEFAFTGWTRPTSRPEGRSVHVLTPPTSVAALAHGFVPKLHPSAIQ